MDVSAMAQQALRLQKAGDFAGAEKLYAQLLKRVRDNPALWFNHALVLRDLSRPAEAVAGFDRVLELIPAASPQVAEVLNERAGALMALDRFEEALIALDRAISLRAGYAGALANRGRALKELKRPQEAL